ncbi:MULTISPECIES: phosphoribosyl-ATP diphosphatase [Halobacterium]|uniref:Phosphoribosyl-ATP pyrophosphatase n=4 Tax=Halobacterium salinarum TaxID=2242 RepID=HIS2_HALSA|nr:MULTISPECIES: phosphoribosyl-ATP diphosphatase [Halobacterium]B0R877.1 RecName: Full=Phosphoribosyl-ATP pyrophosphatase; Short=PRA-PH [Halobacterium salinarum R1]Q9HMD4.1 RecName: Full=Phosphoribosyl-ATP pyrophosphatase; Short=PRA-PH [Halobacterium salinarum NRC-1]AAG20637.1 phosphoribosyl-AMP cyclohydrolase [Halobacterium salinarum NRC-1]MBB6089428.1 phosphoribosyl-ATP pyrophosphohydrolase [Halobacterium salinarum]MCF2164587.1 phosphoribosyl-ATP diphosphatase [Halobacterium salinarum]MCF2
MSDPLRELFDVIEDRKETMPENSYTASLLADDEKGENAALEKVGEEATEFLLAAKDGDTDELAHEGADVVYHMLVVLAQQDMDVEALLAELDDRR